MMYNENEIWRTIIIMHKKSFLPDKIFVISFLSGAAALIYELISQRYLSLIMGSEAYTVAVVVGCYMIGLSVGSIAFGAFSDRHQGLSLKLSILGFAVLCGISPLIYQLISSSVRSNSLAARVMICFIFVIPVAICAGGVVPSLIKNAYNIARPSVASSQESEVRSQNKTRDTSNANGSREKVCNKNKNFEDNTLTRPSVASSQESEVRSQNKTRDTSNANGSRGKICNKNKIFEDNTIARSSAKSPAYIYAANTLGAVAGALICGYLLIRTLGLTATALLASCLTLFCAALVFIGSARSANSAGSARSNHRTSRAVALEPQGYSRIIVAVVIAAYCVSGFASMTFQVFQTKILTLFFRDSVYDFAIILTVYLIGLFAGNMSGGRVATKQRNLLFVFALTQILAGAVVITGLYIVNLMPTFTADLASQTAMFERYGENAFLMSNIIKAGYSAMVVLLPAFLWGMGFPLVNRIALAGEKSVGGTTGFIIGINTLFCSAGPLLSAFWLINFLGVRGLIALSAIMCIVSGAVLAVVVFKKYLRWAAPTTQNGTSGTPSPTTCFLFALTTPKLLTRACAHNPNGTSRTPSPTTCFLFALRSPELLIYILPGVVVLSFCLWIFLPGWDRFEMSTSFLEPGQEVEGSYDILYYEEDIYGIISVVDFFPTNQKFLTTNRRFCQNSSDLYGPEDHQRLGILPLLIHQYPNDVLMVGLGAGITLRGANLFPGVTIDCVEISESVVNAARCFGTENNRVLDADNVNIIIDDGRNYVNNAEKRYDVIIADIFFPMSSGSSSLFSLEYYKKCKGLLNRYGLMVQWIPVHQFSKYELDIVIKTFSSVFENCQLWYGLIGKSVPVIGIVGSDARLMIDGARLSELYDDKMLSGALSMIALDDEYMMLSHFITDVKDTAVFCEDIPINTDDRPILEYLNPENNVPYYQRLDENIQYVSAYKSIVPLNEYFTNINKQLMEDYNSSILDFISGIFKTAPLNT